MNLAKILLDLGRNVAHPFAEAGTAVAYTPKALYGIAQNKPIDDIQRKVFGTNDQGKIAKKIVGDVSSIGLTAAVPSISRLAPQGLAKQSLFGAASGGLLGGAMNLAGSVGAGNDPTLRTFGEGALVGGLLGGAGPLGRSLYLNRTPLNQAGTIQLGKTREVVTGAPGEFKDLVSLVSRGKLSPKTEIVPMSKLKFGGGTWVDSPPDQATIQKYMNMIKLDKKVAPLVVDSNGSLVQDGRHRLIAMRRMGITNVPVVRETPKLSGAAQQSFLSKR